MEMLRETFFMKGFITAMVIAVLTKVIVWANYHRLLVSSEEVQIPYICSVHINNIVEFIIIRPRDLFRSVRNQRDSHFTKFFYSSSVRRISNLLGTRRKTINYKLLFKTKTHIHLIPIVEEKDMYFDKPKLSLPAEEMQAIATAIAAELNK